MQNQYKFQWLLTIIFTLFAAVVNAQDNLTHVFLANQTRLPLTLKPKVTGNTGSVEIGKLNFAPHEITHNHASTIAVGDLIRIPEKDHNEANSSLKCKRLVSGGTNNFVAELEVQHQDSTLFTIVVESKDATPFGNTKFYYNIRRKDGTLELTAPGLQIRDDRGLQVQEAAEIEFQGVIYRLIYGVFDENQDNSDNIIYSISNKIDTINHFDPPASDTLNPNVLNVISYNTAFLMPLNISDQDENIKIKVFHKIIPKNMDFIVFQEVFEPQKAEILFENLKPYYPYHTGRHNKILIQGIGKDGGVRIVSKYPILEEKEISYSENGCEPEDFFSKFANKGVKYAKINKQGQIIHIFGTHTSEQPCDLYVMGKVMADLNIPKDEVVIMAGDFNVDMNNFDPQTNEDVYTIMLDTLNAVEPTYLSFLNDRSYTGSTSGLNHYYCCSIDGRQQLDYVFASAAHKVPKLITNRSQIGRLNEADESFGIFDMSDHEPMYSRIEFPAVSTTNTAISNCIGETVTLQTNLIESASNGRFQWYKGDNIIEGANSNTLEITISAATDFTNYSCTYSYEYMPDTVINNFFDPAYMDYQWYFRGKTRAELTTTFIVAPTDSSESCFGITTLLPQQFATAPFKIFPNPASQFIEIYGDEMSGFVFEILDIQGRKMLNETFVASGSNTRIPVKSFSPGTYFVRGTHNNQTFVAPFIKN